MNNIFNWCVEFLNNMSHVLGMTYEELNVIIFVFAYPIVLSLAIAYIIVLKKRLNKLRSANQ